MKLDKPPPKLIETFEAVTPGPPAQPRKMFGYPSAFVNGNMFMGLFRDTMIVRLPEEMRENLFALGGRPFEPMPGRPMREYVVVPDHVLSDRKALTSWVSKSMEYGSSLPAKAKKPKVGSASKPKTRARKS